MKNKNNNEFYITLTVLGILGIVIILTMTSRRRNVLDGIDCTDDNEYVTRKELNSILKTSKRKMIKGPEVNWEGADI